MSQGESSQESSPTEGGFSPPAGAAEAGESAHASSGATADLGWPTKLIALVAGLHLLSALPHLMTAWVERSMPIPGILLEFAAIVLAGIGVYAASIESRRLLRWTSIPALVIATPMFRYGFLFFCPVIVNFHFKVGAGEIGQISNFVGFNIVSLVLLLALLWLTRNPRRPAA